MLRDPELHRQYMRKRYEERKNAGKCIDCAATLQEDDGLRCVEHEEAAQRSKQKYNAKQSTRKQHQNRRERLRSEKRCISCGRPQADGSSMYCQEHLEMRREYQRAYKERKEAGITSLPKRKELKRDKSGSPPIDSYIAIDEALSRPRSRVLLAASWMEWFTFEELRINLRVPVWTEGGDNREYDAHCQIASRLAKRGLLEKRQLPRSAPEFRITAAGREEAKRIRNGDFGRLYLEAA